LFAGSTEKADGLNGCYFVSEDKTSRCRHAVSLLAQKETRNLPQMKFIIQEKP
jgi:hypothetical protein